MVLSDSFLNKSVKLVFKDGEAIRTLKGIIKKINKDSLELETLNGHSLIANSEILQIKPRRGENGNEK